LLRLYIIKEIPETERPRERLEHYGPQALSVAELLAIILRTGTKDENVVMLATRLVAHYHGLAGLAQAPFSELVTIKGLGRVKAVELKAAFELGRRGWWWPSPEDVSVTRQIVEAGKLLNIDVLDHLVIGHQRWVSLKERGLGF
jgi:DNA repair protein RadC